MLFLPTMEQLRINIKQTCAANKHSSELFTSLQDQIMNSVAKPPFNIAEPDFDLDEFNLVDTNLTVI